MNISDYIVKDLKALGLKSTIKSAQKQCKNYLTTHIPIVENDVLIGVFAESDVHTVENKDDILSKYTYLFDLFFAEETSSILELLKLFADNDCNIIPVLNADKKYIGYFDLSDVLDVFTNTPFLFDESMSIVVAKNEKEYSMSEISQIVESNDAKLLGLYISKRNADNVEVTVKISTEKINEIIQTFRRYNYNVITQHKDDAYLEDLKDRSEYLQKYLKM